MVMINSMTISAFKFKIGHTIPLQCHNLFLNEKYNCVAFFKIDLSVVKMYIIDYSKAFRAFREENCSTINILYLLSPGWNYRAVL